MAEALRIQNLSKRFDKTLALDDVTFDVPMGSIFGLLGPNGAGKTTLFSIAAGFLSADGGSLRVLGTDISHVSELQGRMTILPQDAAFQRNVPIVEQLTFLRRLDGSDVATAQREVTEAMERVGISVDTDHLGDASGQVGGVRVEVPVVEGEGDPVVAEVGEDSEDVA